MTDTSNNRYLHSVIDISRGLHGAICGTCDMFNNNEELVEWLRWRISNEGWLPSHKEWKRFDNSVRALAKAALFEFELEVNKI